MKEIIIAVNLLSALMLIIVVVFFIRGIIILFRGKCKLKKYLVKGKEAKAIGLSFIIVPILLIILLAVLYENFNWGSGANESAILVYPIVQSILFIIGLGIVYSWSLSKAKTFQLGLNQQNEKAAEMNKLKPKVDLQKLDMKVGQEKKTRESQPPLIKESQTSTSSTDISGKKDREIIERNLDISMIDFYKEHEQIINFGLAQSKPDINIINWYRITTKDKSVINPKDGLLFKNARIICGGGHGQIGKFENIINLEHYNLQTPQGDLLMQMEGPLRFYSKCQFSCACGISYMIYADATIGKANECYLTVYTNNPPDKLAIFVRPFFEIDEVSLVSL